MLLVIEDRRFFHLLQRPEPAERSTALALQRMGGFATPPRPPQPPRGLPPSNPLARSQW